MSGNIVDTWTDEDEDAANFRGWSAHMGEIKRSAIQCEDHECTATGQHFHSDEAALLYVEKRAAQGSLLARKALRLIARFKHRSQIQREQFILDGRDAVLKALDEYAREIGAGVAFLGATDAELPALFRGIDAHLLEMSARINQSHRCGVAIVEEVKE